MEMAIRRRICVFPVLRCSRRSGDEVRGDGVEAAQHDVDRGVAVDEEREHRERAVVPALGDPRVHRGVPARSASRREIAHGRTISRE